MAVVILTGAGISAESGLATFRSSDGLWNNYPAEEVASIDGFQKNQALVFDFYRELAEQMSSAKPNAAHKAIADFQKKTETVLITQNVDLLHEKAGSLNVWHMHGRIDESVCLNCGHVTQGLVGADSSCAFCGMEQMMKPNIVFFGETPYYLNEIEKAIFNYWK